MRKVKLSPPWLILGGLLGVTLGVVLPMLMVLKMLPSTFWLNFLAYAFSVTGLVLGVVGAAWQTRIDRAKRKRDDI